MHLARLILFAVMQAGIEGNVVSASSHSQQEMQLPTAITAQLDPTTATPLAAAHLAKVAHLFEKHATASGFGAVSVHMDHSRLGICCAYTAPTDTAVEAQAGKATTPDFLRASFPAAAAVRMPPLYAVWMAAASASASHSAVRTREGMG